MTRLPLTPRQQRKLDRRDKAPWRWFVSDKAYFRLEDRFERRNMRRYIDLMNRCVTYDGPDYRILLPGQGTWIRATRLQYEQAETCGVPRHIGVPGPPAVLAPVPALAA